MFKEITIKKSLKMNKSVELTDKARLFSAIINGDVKLPHEKFKEKFVQLNYMVEGKPKEMRKYYMKAEVYRELMQSKT